MAADSHGHDGPVIASSNRYTDLAPYCGRIYAAEHHKWRDVLPWDFPPAATKDDEEAFLRTYFTDREIYVQGGAPNGYKFLKQVWYCIAMWNVQVKVPRVAEQWIRMGITAADPTMTDFIMAEEAELKTFFSKQEIEKYGEKLLGVAVKHIQYLVSSARRDSGMDQVTGNFVHDGGVAQPVPEPLADDARDTTNAHDERRTGTLQPASQPNVTRSAQPQKVGLALTDHPASSDQTVPGPVRRPRAGSSVDYTSYMPPAPQSRKRGNSNAKPNNIRNATAHRYEQHQQRSGAIFNSPYQQSPQFNMAAPTIGNDRSFSNTQPYPMHNQMRMPSDFTPNYVQFPSNYPQQLQGPPPPGMYGPGLPQQAGPPGLVFDERNFQPAPSAFRPPPYQQPPPVYYSNSQLNDRTNDRSVNDQFNNGMHAGEDMYGGMRGGKRHVSNASRNSRPRGYSNSGRGKGSRGNRNSFTGPRPQNDFFDGPTWAHQPSVDQGLTQGSDGGYSNRRTSAAGGNWGGNASKPQYQPNENMQPARAFSGPEGPEGFNPTRPVFWAQSSGNTGLPPRQPGHDTFEPGFRRPSDSHNSQVSNQQAPYNARQRAYSTSQPPQDELLHDPAHPMAALYPGRLVTENHIGIDCGHVRKLLIFAMPGEIRPQQVSQLFERCGPVTAVNGYPPSDRVKTDYKGREVRDVWITFRDHLAAMNALKMDGQQLFPGAQLKIRVPREYWEITHERYPGQGHPQQRPRVYGPNRRFSFEPSMPENTPMQAPPAMPEHREPQRGQHASGGSTPVARAPADPKLHKELLSGSTTPTPSGGSSPKKKKQNRGKGKTKPSVLLGDAVADAAKEMEKRADSVRAKSKAKNDAVADLTVSAENPPKAKATQTTETSKDSSIVTQPEPLSIDTAASARGSVSTQSGEPVQTTSEIAFTPATEVTARLPQLQKPATVQDNAEADAMQPFRKPPASTKEKAGEPGPVDVAFAAKAEEEAEPASQGGGKEEARQSASAAMKSKTGAGEADLPEKIDVEPVDDSFHTAKGTPDHDQQGRADRQRDRESEESTVTNDTSFTDATDRSRASTVIHRPETPIAGVSSGTTIIVSSKSEPPAAESAAPSDGIAEPLAADGTSPITRSPGLIHPQIATASRSPASTSTASAAKNLSKNAPVALPKVRIIEPPKSQGDDKVSFNASQRTTSGNSVPPTPAFVTAPNTPALPDETEKPDIDPGQTGKEPEPSQQTAKTADKLEKPKGPAQTTSLLGGLFAKPQRQKPKKPKAQKGKGSMRGRPKTDDDVVSEAPSEDLMDRIVSGTMQLGAPTDKRAATPEVGTNGTRGSVRGQVTTKRNDSKVRKAADARGSDKSEDAEVPGSERDNKEPTFKPLSRDVSPLKFGGAIDNIISFLGSSISPPALTLKTKTEEPSQQQPNPTVAQSDGLATKGTEPRQTAGAQTDAGFDRIFTGRYELPAQLRIGSSDSAFLGCSKQPFRSFRKDVLTDGACDGGDGSGASGGGVGLGIITAPATSLDAAAVNEEGAKPKKKKRKAAKKKKSEGLEQAYGDSEDVGAGAEAKLPLEDDERVLEAGEVFQFRFEAYSGPATGPSLSRDAASEAPSQTLMSEAGSEASSRTLGRSTSHDQTPSSTAAASSTHGSPSRLHNMIKRQSDGVIVPAPNRTLLRRKKNLSRMASGANKTPESEVSSPMDAKGEEMNSVWVDEDPESSDDDDEVEEAGKSLDKVLDQAQRQTMKQSRPMLYLYVGPGRQEKKEEESGKKARVEEVVEDDAEEAPDVGEEILDEALKRWTEREQGKKT